MPHSTLVNAPLVSDPAFCLRRAEEMRAMAEIVEDDGVRDRLLGIASGYEVMAARARLRRAASPLKDAAD